MSVWRYPKSSSPFNPFLRLDADEQRALLGARAGLLVQYGLHYLSAGRLSTGERYPIRVIRALEMHRLIARNDSQSFCITKAGERAADQIKRRAAAEAKRART